MAHGIPAFALRLEAAGRSLTYAGDTAPCAVLTSLAEGCDVLLCEAESAQAPIEGDQVHHTPEDAGETSGAARVGRLIVTHVGPFLTPPASGPGLRAKGRPWGLLRQVMRRSSLLRCQ